MNCHCSFVINLKHVNIIVNETSFDFRLFYCQCNALRLLLSQNFAKNGITLFHLKKTQRLTSWL